MQLLEWRQAGEVDGEAVTLEDRFEDVALHASGHPDFWRGVCIGLPLAAPIEVELPKGLQLHADRWRQILYQSGRARRPVSFAQARVTYSRRYHCWPPFGLPGMPAGRDTKSAAWRAKIT